MKNFKVMLMTLMFCVLTMFSFGQTKQERINQMSSFISDSTINSNYDYCTILGTSNLMGTKVSVEIDFGQKRNWGQSNQYIDPETGEKVKFNSMVDAMNFMGRNGWEFIQAYVVTHGNQSVYHFLLKRTKK